MSKQETDTAGNQWAKLSQLKAGDWIKADDGFTCIKHGAILQVRCDSDGDLFVPCRSGGHSLSGQADDGEHIIGFYSVKVAAP